MDDRTRMLDLIGSIEKDANASEGLKSKAASLQSELANGPGYQNDILIYRAVVLILGITVLATVFGGLGLAWHGNPNFKLPSEIVAIGSAAVGALAGLLAPSPQAKAT